MANLENIGLSLPYIDQESHYNRKVTTRLPSICKATLTLRLQNLPTVTRTFRQELMQGCSSKFITKSLPSFVIPTTADSWVNWNYSRSKRITLTVLSEGPFAPLR